MENVIKLSGKVTEVKPLETGEGANGTWYKQCFIIETPGLYPKNQIISGWKKEMTDKVNSLKPLDDVIVSVNIESKENKGRWYTELKAWKIETV